MTKTLKTSLKRACNLVLMVTLPLFMTGCSLIPGTSSSDTASKAAAAKQTITIWRRVADTKAEETAFRTLLAGWQKSSGVTVNYKSFKPTDDYETAVIDALAAGNGPDVWEIRDDELTRHKDKLFGLPLTDPQINSYNQTLARSISQQMIADKKLYGLPEAIDPLVLYINESHLKAAKLATAPKTWADAIKMAQKLTIVHNGQILRPGLALGTVSNIDRASDIIQTLMQQYGTEMTDPAGTIATFDLYVDDPEKGFRYPAQEAIKFYEGFADPKSGYQTWDKSQPYTTQAFLQGKLSMMINYLSVSPQLRSLEPKLKYSVAPLPQFEEKRIPVGDIPASISDPVTTAKYRALVVSKPSVRLVKTAQDTQTSNAWKLISYITNTKNNVAYANKIGLLSNQNVVSSTSGLAVLNSRINPYLASWQKGVSPRAVDEVFAKMLKAIVEDGLDPALTLSQGATAVSGILK